MNPSQKEEINSRNKEFYHAVTGLDFARFHTSVTANKVTLSSVLEFIHVLLYDGNTGTSCNSVSPYELQNRKMANTVITSANIEP
jgi:hypothetical protein